MCLDGGFASFREKATSVAKYETHMRHTRSARAAAPTFGRGVAQDEVFVALLHDPDDEHGAPVLLLDGAQVAAAPVGVARAPVEPAGLVAHGEERLRRVEGRHLLREQLAQRVEDEAPDAEGVLPLPPLHEARDLPHLVPLHVHPPEDREVAQLLLVNPLGFVHGAKHSFILKKHALCFNGTGEVVSVGAAKPVAAAGGAHFVAEDTFHLQAPPQRELYVH